MWIYGGYGLGGVAPAAPEPSKPEPLSSVMMGYGKQWADGERGYTRVTCGLLNSMYVLDFGGMTWQHVQHIQNGADGTPHHVKNHSAMVYGHKMYIFGGCTLEVCAAESVGCLYVYEYVWVGVGGVCVWVCVCGCVCVPRTMFLSSF